MLEINQSILESLDLSKNEVKVYLALLKLGSDSVSEIALKSGVHRVNVYDALKRLQKKGLVSSVVKSEKKYFEPASPQEIKQIISKKENEINKVKEMIPQLMDIYSQEKSKQVVHHYFGKKGLITVYNNMVDQMPLAGQMYAIGSTGVMRNYFPVYVKQFVRKMKEKNISAKVLYQTSAKNVKPFEVTQVKYLPKGMDFMPMTFYLYGGWVAIVSFEPLLAIEIQSEKIYQNFLKYYKWLDSISSE